MGTVFDKLKDFYKEQPIEKADSVHDPMAVAQYVKTRYGTGKTVHQIARGIAGKSRAREWNPVQVSSDTKRKEKGSMFTETKGGNLQARSRKTHTKKAIDLDKADTVRDSTKLAHHLAGGGDVAAGHAQSGGAWSKFEGGIKDKDNAKEWNPIDVPDARGYKYDSTGKRLPKEGEPKKKKEPQARVGGKFGRKKGGEVSVSPTFASAKGGKDFRRGGPGGKKKAIMNMLLKAHKFGGSPLKWEDLPRDPISFATNVLQHKGFKNTNLSSGTKGAKMRNKLSQGIRELIRDVPEATKKEVKAGKMKDQRNQEEAEKMAEKIKNSWKNGDHDMEKASLSPALARILGFGAGWAMSDSFTEAPRGRMTPSQQRDWERLVRSSMRRKKNLSKDSIDALKTYYNDKSDTYVKRVPIDNSLNIMKDHAPIPPRQGLVWDEQKKHWTRPEHVGHSVSEVQGKKRIRGTGTGVHEHSLAVGRVGGKGAGASAEAGRRFRSAADSGIIEPHEAKHPSTHHLTSSKTKPAKSAVRKFLARRGHKTTA